MKPIAIAQHFQIQGTPKSCAPYGDGHINETYLLTTDCQVYILQKINHHVFHNPPAVMENIVNITTHLKKKLNAAGEDSRRKCLNVIPSKTGSSYYLDGADYWRMYLFISNSLSLNQVETSDEFYDSGLAFGRFFALLADFPAATLNETIPNFHHTPKRFEALTAACREDKAHRLSAVTEEVAFFNARADFTHYLVDRIASGELPLVVTHNDTKLNNILFDATTREALCILDLDTIMPGLSAYDFGDSIRFGASTALEDEPDLSKVHFDLSLYEVYAKGYLLGCGGQLTPAEVDALPYGAIMMTLENGIRFLADYLNGDTYYKIHRESHNLDRCRTQIRLVSEMEQQLPDMKKIIQRWCTQ